VEYSNNNTYTQQQKIGLKLSGVSGKLYYSAIKNNRRSEDRNRRPDTVGIPKEPVGNSVVPKGAGRGLTDERHSVKDEESSRYCIQTYSQRHKTIRRLFKIQEEVLNKDIHRTVRHCRRVQAFHTKEITAQEGKKSGQIKGIFLCGSSHCPACFSHIAQQKRNQLKKVIEHSKEKRMRIAMLTLTFSHQFGNNLQQICDSLRAAKTYLIRQRKFKKIDIQWHISRLEFTYSKYNGFHPHYHIAMGINGGINEDEIKNEWIRVCKKFGLECSYERGADLLIDEKFEGVEKYIMKDGSQRVRASEEWRDSEGTRGQLSCPVMREGSERGRLEFEIGSDGIKKGRIDNVTIDYLMDVLAGFEKEKHYSKEQIKKILLAYYAGIKGKAIFSVSNKFKDIVENLEKEKEESEPDEQEQTPGAPSLKIGRWVLHYLAKTNRLNYLYDFVGHNNLTKLYDDLLFIVPEQMIGGIVWIDGIDEDRQSEKRASYEWRDSEGTRGRIMRPVMRERLGVSELAA